MEEKSRRQDQINLIMTLRSRGILDKDVLNAIERIPRHLFVSEAFANYAYRDMALPIGEGQTIPEPYLIAQICEALWLKENSRVLVIGTGSGYLTAVLSKLVRRVYTVEILRSMMVTAEKRFQDLKLENIATDVGDGWEGWLDQSPFDGIVIAAAVDDLPLKLFEQLKPKGIIIYPQIQQGTQQQLLALKNYEDKPEIKTLSEVYFAPLVKETVEKG